MKRVMVCAAAALAIVMFMAGCGSSNSSSSTTTVAVAVSPATATVNTAATQQFTATISNSTNTAVTWEVNGLAGGNQTVGFISSSGLYTAPQTVPTPASVTITAISQANTSIAGTATVTITASTTPSATLVISPTAATVPAGGQQGFTATVGGSSAPVTWSVSCQSTATGACGTISTGGIYTAPLSPPLGANVSITATPQNTNSAASAGAVVTVQFGNGTLSGQYAFSVSGQNAGAAYLAAGSITFDGGGNIAGGVEDINSAGTVSPNVAINSGSYHVGTDGRGTITLNTGVGSMNWQFVAINHSHALLIRFDSGVQSASGTMDLQDSTQFSSAGFSGGYAFNLSGANGSGKAGTLATAGAFTSSGGGLITGGVQDVNNAGTASNSAFSGSYVPPLASGRGTMMLNGTNNFAFYVIDATHVKLIGIDSGTQLLGDAFKQAAGPFGNASYKGGFAFTLLGSRGGSPLGEGGVITFDGAGNVRCAAGLPCMDINANGNPQTALTASGTYTVADTVTGRATASLTVAGTTLQYAMYPQANGGISIVETDSTNVAAGRALPQAAGSFANGSVVGDYGLNLGGVDFTTNPGEEDLVGHAFANGGSTLGANAADPSLADISDNGLLGRSAALSASYALTLSGRSSSATMSAAAGSGASLPASAFVFYVVDSSNVLLLEIDGRGVLVGAMQKQF